jgi:hypothetical protein
LTLDLKAERAAAESYMRLLDAVADCIRLHEEAHLPKPSLLQKLSANGAARDRKAEGSIATKLIKPLPPPAFENRPSNVPIDWIWVPISEASVSNLVRAFVKSEGRVTTAGLLDFLQERNPKVGQGTSYNTISRLLKTGQLQRKGDFYRLGEGVGAGIVDSGRLWNAKSGFEPMELAWFRRRQVVRTLQLFGPLQVFQIANVLKASDWIPGAVNKDNIKLDVVTLESQKEIRRNDTTKQWEAVAR